MNALAIAGKDGSLQAWTVGDLRSALAQQPDDALVIISSDAEGNGYHPLMEIWEKAHYRGAGWGSEIIEGRPRKTDKPSIVLIPMD